MPLESIDPDLSRIREFTRPGCLPCAWQTAHYRVMIRAIARDARADGSEIVYAEADIRAEFRAILSECPELPVCPCHAKEQAAAIEATGQG